MLGFNRKLKKNVPLKELLKTLDELEKLVNTNYSTPAEKESGLTVIMTLRDSLNDAKSWR